MILIRNHPQAAQSLLQVGSELENLEDPFPVSANQLGVKNIAILGHPKQTWLIFVPKSMVKDENHFFFKKTLFGEPFLLNQSIAIRFLKLSEPPRELRRWDPTSLGESPRGATFVPTKHDT